MPFLWFLVCIYVFVCSERWKFSRLCKHAVRSGCLLLSSTPVGFTLEKYYLIPAQRRKFHCILLLLLGYYHFLNVSSIFKELIVWTKIETKTINRKYLLNIGSQMEDMKDFFLNIYLQLFITCLLCIQTSKRSF